MTIRFGHILKWFVSVVGVTLLILAAGAVIFRGELKDVLLKTVESRASEALGRRVAIGDMRIRLPLTLILRDVSVSNLSGFDGDPLLRVRNIAITVDAGDLVRRKLHVRKIDLTSPSLVLIQNDDGAINLTGLGGAGGRERGADYRIDEVVLDDGTVILRGGDRRYELRRIRIDLRNLSTVTEAGSELHALFEVADSGVVTVDGRLLPPGESKTFSLTVGSERLSLAALNDRLRVYGIRTDEGSASFDIRLEGDLEQGIEIRSTSSIKGISAESLARDLPATEITADCVLDLREASLSVRRASLLLGDAGSVELRGTINDLLETPSYKADLALAVPDLEAFRFPGGYIARGALMADRLHLEGASGKLSPRASGLIALRGVSLKGPGLDLRNMGGEIHVTSGEGLSADGALSGEIVSAAGYLMDRPAPFTVRAGAIAGRDGWSASGHAEVASGILNPSPGKEMKLEDVRLHAQAHQGQGRLSGSLKAETAKIRYLDRSVEDLSSSVSFNYEGGVLHLADLRIDSSEGMISARTASFGRGEGNGMTTLDVDGLSAELSRRSFVLNGFRAEGSAGHQAGHVNSDIGFSAGKLKYEGIEADGIRGRIRILEGTTSLDVSQAVFAGGNLRGSLHGGELDDLFPVRSELVAEEMDLAVISAISGHYFRNPYDLEGRLVSGSFSGSFSSPEILSGTSLLKVEGVTVFGADVPRRSILQNVAAEVEAGIDGDDGWFSADVGIGTISALLSGRGQDIASGERSITFAIELPPIPADEIRNSLWDVVPDGLLYVGLGGSVASHLSARVGGDSPEISGNILFRDFVITGENEEYSIGPVNGMVPVYYGRGPDGKRRTPMPSFEKKDHEELETRYAGMTGKDNYHVVTVDAVRYGFRLLENVEFWIRQEGAVVAVDRISGNIFGGKLFGAAELDTSRGISYRLGLLLDGMSLTSLCDSVEPVRGYLSGKLDGVALIKGSADGVKDILGKAEFWTYGSDDEETMISRELLRRIGGPAVKSYIGDRRFDKGVMSLYFSKGFIVFRELEISNRNLLGVQDLSVKVAPLSNRIAIDHLMWTIVEAAARAKEN